MNALTAKELYSKFYNQMLENNRTFNDSFRGMSLNEMVDVIIYHFREVLNLEKTREEIFEYDKSGGLVHVFCWFKVAEKWINGEDK